MGTRYTGLSKAMEDLADKVPVYKGVDFVDYWNDFVKAVKINDYKKINPIFEDSPHEAALVTTSNLSEKQKTTISLATEETYAANYLLIYSGIPPVNCKQADKCSHCWDEKYKAHKDFIHSYTTDNTTVYIFSYTEELKKILEDKTKEAETLLQEKKIMQNTLNRVNLGEITPWAFVKGLEHEIDYAKLKELKKATEQEARLKEQYSKVTITLADYEKLQKAYENEDYTLKLWNKYPELQSAVHNFAELKKEQRETRLMIIELEELRKMFGVESALERYMNNQDGYYGKSRLEKEVENTNSGIASKKAEIKRVLTHFKEALDFKNNPIKSEALQNYEKALKEFYAKGWEEAWGPVPD